jgi:hypothetical protein
MAPAITVMGKQPSAPTRIITGTVDFTAITSYATGGHEDTALSAELAGLTFFNSIPMPAYDSTDNFWFYVKSADNKIIGYTDATLATEITATDDLSGFTAIQILVIGY